MFQELTPYTGITPPPPTSTVIPIPANANAVTYVDYFSGQIKQGFQIGQGQNYIVYDTATSAPVKRVSNGVIEEGKFEYIAALQSDGSVSIDYRNPKYLSAGTVQYTTPQNGRVRLVVVDKKVYEIYSDVAAPDIVLNPGTTKDATNKILNGVVKVLTLGLELSVANGAVSKSTGGAQGSEELTKKARAVFIFGNGFNNALVVEGTPDVLMPPYVGMLESRGIIDSTRKLLVALYENTAILGNMSDWLSDFVFQVKTGPAIVQEFVARFGNDPLFYADVIASAIPIQDMPESVQKWILWIQDLHRGWAMGLQNDLVAEVYSDLLAFDSAKGIKDGIVFTHSGAFQPFIEALGLAKPDGTKFDVRTIINYEGPYWFFDDQYVDNANVARLINVWGTGSDFAPTAWSVDNYTFSGPQRITNINIKILGALHNDFSYSATDPRWTANPDANKRTEREVNFRTSVFMQELYRATKEQEVNGSSLEIFFEALKVQGSATVVDGTWLIDPLKLPYPIDYVY